MRLSIFPLPGAILFPGLALPLHIFEPRYRAMASDALARDRRIAVIQPRGGSGSTGHIGKCPASRCSTRIPVRLDLPT